MADAAAVGRRRGAAWKPIAAATLAALAVAVLGGLMTDIGPWYRSLREPAWKPPDWLFGPAWTFIYACTAAAGVLAWRAAPSPRSREWLLVAFAFNAFVNVLWSLLFFRVQRPDWALLEVGVLWSSIVVLIGLCGRLSRPAAAMLVPYLAWVSFAAVLNAAVVDLNAPFPGR